MKTWPLMTSLALIALACAGPSPGAADSQPEQAQAKGPTGEDLARDAGAPLIGKYAPALTLKTVDGKTIDLARLYGKKPVYLKFWATWCVPCRLQMPHFENVERTLGGDMQVVAVNTGFNDSKDAVLRYRQAMGLTMPIAIDDGRLADALHLRVTPQHIVIGRDGRILHVGQQADARLDRALAQAIAGAPAPYAPGDAVRGGGRAPVPTLKTLTGQPLALHEKARPTVVFFFSPWCETYLKSSRPEMAEACLKAREEVSQARRGPSIRWVGVAAGLWATQQDLSAYQRDHSLPMPVALDETGAVFRAFRISNVPAFVVLDGAGHVVARANRADQAAGAAARFAQAHTPARTL